MIKLESASSKNVRDRFKTGKFVIQSTSKYWVGLPYELVIEQVLMRSFQSARGQARGAGMSDVKRFIGLLSNPIYSWHEIMLKQNLRVVCKNNDHQIFVWKQESTDTTATLQSRFTRC